MSQTLILLRKSMLTFRRARAAVVITFLVPILLIYIFGHVFGLYRKESGPSGINLAIVNESHEPAATQLIDALKREKVFAVITDKKHSDGSTAPLTESDARRGLEQNAYRYALLIPADLLSDARIGVRLKFLTNPRNDIEAQTVEGVLQKTVFSNVPQLLGQSLQRQARAALGQAGYRDFTSALARAVANGFGGDAELIQRQIEEGSLLPGIESATSGTSAAGSATGGSAENVISRLISIESEQVAGKQVRNPMAARIVGGYAIMFLLFAVSGAASSMFEEKATGVFQRLLASPVCPAHIVWARFLFGILLGLVQISVLFIAGRLFFGLEILRQPAALLAVAVAAAAACSSFGLFVASVSPSPAAAQGLATFVVLSMSAIGGAWFPVSFMPEYIQAISKATIVYWSVEGFTDVLWAGRSLGAVLPKVGILAGMSAAVMAFSLWRFQRNRFFE